MKDKPRLLVFASGSLTGGGSGFENLVNATRIKSNQFGPTETLGGLWADIVAVVSNHEHGGVRERADRLGVPFIFFPGPFEAGEYQRIINDNDAEYVALSGWLKLVSGLDPKTTFNIHPGPLPRFGGKGMYGRHVHEAIMEAFRNREVTHSAVTMHFVTEKYDEGPIFFEHPIEIRENDTPESLAERVGLEEKRWQPIITNKVVLGEISWDGTNPESLIGRISN
jgi:phosphoribosylglycinamide formyltransferase 1